MPRASSAIAPAPTARIIAEIPNAATILNSPFSLFSSVYTSELKKVLQQNSSHVFPQNFHGMPESWKLYGKLFPEKGERGLFPQNFHGVPESWKLYGKLFPEKGEHELSIEQIDRGRLVNQSLLRQPLLRYSFKIFVSTQHIFYPINKVLFLLLWKKQRQTPTRACSRSFFVRFSRMAIPTIPATKSNAEPTNVRYMPTSPFGLTSNKSKRAFL